MLALLQNAPPRGLGQPYTVHGFRSSFHDWASESGDWPEHVIDQALAHKISDEVKAAYRRGNLLAKRRQLMDEWADYVTAASSRRNRSSCPRAMNRASWSNRKL
jgi:integrase